MCRCNKLSTNPNNKHDSSNMSTISVASSVMSTSSAAQQKRKAPPPPQAKKKNNLLAAAPVIHEETPSLVQREEEQLMEGKRVLPQVPRSEYSSAVPGEERKVK